MTIGKDSGISFENSNSGYAYSIDDESNDLLSEARNSIQDPSLIAALEQFLDTLEIVNQFRSSAAGRNAEERVEILISLDEATKELTELLISSTAIEAGTLERIINEMRVSLIDLIFPKDLKPGEQDLSKEEKLIIGEILVEFTLTSTPYQREKPVDAKQSENLQNMQALLECIKEDNQPSLLLLGRDEHSANEATSEQFEEEETEGSDSEGFGENKISKEKEPSSGSTNSKAKPPHPASHKGPTAHGTSDRGKSSPIG